MKKIIGILSILMMCSSAVFGQKQGVYYSKKAQTGYKVPEWTQTRHLLPAPVYEQNPLWVETYYKAWELAFRNFYAPTEASGFISLFADAAFCENIFLWDTSFITMFCNYADGLVPGICSLDNFYAKQHESGEICREINRRNGKDFTPWVNEKHEPLFSRWGYNIAEKLEKTFISYIGREAPDRASTNTLDAMDHPILAWAEVESYKVTGNKERLMNVYEPLKQYYYALQRYIRQGNGLYMTDWASMDNSTRNIHLKGGGTGIDISSEMALFAKNLAYIATVAGKKSEAATFKKEAKQLISAINRQMWSEQQGFYYDLRLDGSQVGIKTVAGFWPLLAEVADKKQAAQLVRQLENPHTFATQNLVPTLSADEQGFSENGNYWCGSVWAPTTTMVIMGLENYGYSALAEKIAINHIALVANVFASTGTIWENYSPNKEDHGYLADGGNVVRDFVGWSGIAPIKLFLEYGIGLRPDAPQNTLNWILAGNSKTGCRNYRFNSNLVSLIAEQGAVSKQIEIDSEKPFVLVVKKGNSVEKFQIKKGHQMINMSK